MSKRTHARYSPSQLDGLQKCLRFKFKETKAMEEAGDEGTMLHFALETGNLDGLDSQQSMDVQMSLDYVKCIKAGIEHLTELHEPTLTLHDLTYGHADVVLIDFGKREIHVIDYKFVRVEGDHTYQVRTYGAAAVEMITSEAGLGGTRLVPELGPITVHTHIVAPRLNKAPEMDSYDGMTLLAEVRAELEALYAEIDDPFNPPSAGHPELCARCARAARCPAVNTAVVLAGPKIGLPLPENFDPQSMVSVQDRAIAHQLATLFENWAKLVKQGNTEFVVNGGVVPGFKLTSRNNGFRIPRENTAQALRLLREELSLGPEQYETALSLSIPELSEALAQVTPESVDVWKSKLMKLLDPCGRNSVSQFLMKEGKGKKGLNA